ncbi:hypothetical protein DL766_006523 [Monosporascus sp. MC13-8B]|nr:hypothetical protein DL766_006523 [Monosporascus sp. MC13-8B]
MVAELTNPEESSSGRAPRYGTLEFHVNTKAGMLWAYINHNLAQEKAFAEVTAELQILTVTGYYCYLNFLKAVNTFSSNFSVTQTAVVEEAMFDGGASNRDNSRNNNGDDRHNHLTK